MVEAYKGHPLHVVLDILKLEGSNFQLEFSYYTYLKDSLEDPRKTFIVQGSEISENSLISLIENCPRGMNLAISSKIVFKDSRGVKHIPMIDLSTPNQLDLHSVPRVLPPELKDSMRWFESGRSFHGYSSTLISEADWIKFMGRLLIANPVDGLAIVDSRWIGHRLISGYGSLRWSKNTFDYLKVPIEITT